jgi:hypothetical protein
MRAVPTSRAARRPRLLLLGALATAVAAGGCIHPFGARGRDVDASGPADSAPVLRIREFAGSARTSVLAWSHDEAHVGLRAEVRRDDGRLTGDFQRGHHTLFLATSYVSTMGGFTRATVPPEHRIFLRRSQGRDDLACYRAGRAQCSPLTTVRLAIPDSVLRASGDSVVVAFHSDWARPWTVSLRRDVVDAYLRAVDSVAAARRARVSTR